MSKNYYIRTAIRRPGRVHKYLMREFGNKAFDNKGKIKSTYLNKAIRIVKKENDLSLERALKLAKTLKARE